jgi:predicted DNA-binding transcriptional regulator YafY
MKHAASLHCALIPVRSEVPKMGRKSGTETVVGILRAFLGERTWSQADLGRALDVSPAAIAKKLAELVENGFPFEREEDHPHVYWSAPPGWFPGAVLFAGQEVVDLLRQLARSPRTALRDRQIARILEAAPRGQGLLPPAGVVAHALPEFEEMYLPAAEDALARRLALRMRYVTTSRGGAPEWRHVSVQRIVLGPPTRIVALCHRSNSLKWFRLDNVMHASTCSDMVVRDASDADVEAFIATSLGGFHEGGEPVECAFVVRDPEAQWVQRNLPQAMDVERIAQGLRVRTKTAGVQQLARFVVGLGGAASAETPELAMMVRELAAGAATTSTAAPRSKALTRPRSARVNTGAVQSKRAGR